MKRKIVLAILLIIFSGKGFSQITFQKLIGGVDRSGSTFVDLTSDGGYIITGWINISINDSTDVYLIKCDSSGNLVWTKTFGGTERDEGRSVKQTSDGGFIIVGYTESFGADTTDVYLIKTDIAGNMLWSKTFGGINADEGILVRQTSDGGYIISGNTYSFGAGGEDILLIKTDAQGNVLFTKTFGGVGTDGAGYVSETNDGGYIISGCTEFGAGVNDVYLIKTNSIGDTLWTKAYGGTNGDCAYYVIQTNDGGYALIGLTSSFGSSTDIYFIKTDTMGNLAWSKTYFGLSYDNGVSVKQTADGGYILAGNTWSFGAGDNDILLICTNDSGDVRWAKAYGENLNDIVIDVQQTNDGGFVVSGMTENFGGSFQVYLIKTDSSGNSGCYESNAATFGTIPSTIVSGTATTVTAPNIITTIPATQINSGGTLTTLCFSVDIKEIYNEENFISILPNPATHEISVQNSKSKIQDVEIFNVMGEIVFSLSLNSPRASTSIDVSMLKAGIYFVSIKDEKNNLIVRKFVKM